MGHPGKTDQGRRAENEGVNRLPDRSVIHRVLLLFYYLFVIGALIILYGRGDFSTPPFIYQGF